MGQQADQALAVDRFAGGPHRALLGQPDQESAVDQSHAGAASVIAKAAFGTGVGREIIAFHEMTCIHMYKTSNVAK
jgi:hypothetical protein